MTTVEKYTQQLIFALRMRDVPGDVIGDAIAQVESHVADTGEDPVEAFGSPREYAATFGGPTVPDPRWPWYVANFLVGFIFGLVLIIGILDQIRGKDLLWGLSPVIAIIIGAVGLIGYFGTLVLISADSIKDPRRTR
ncbi:HAAS signaling domain-containing protein [Rhodococcus tibetensis]|uniref:DUF1700 domain-containing protein n=1 Tax=Rhodococcus tibetensis TaxID=2965064 RepID=A0ABT1QH17_9NOCA|nr:hypothetical protein [Rhodococcus sp. FXJ9.536]MCQ4121080.1 hypothetical protein [Rhodococcus sp. FXJ9.536]